MRDDSIFCSVEEAIEEIKHGRIIVLVDDEDRENEGDLVIGAEKITPEAINFMATYGRGLICLAMSSEKIDRLGLPLMVQDNSSKYGTAFTVSIDAKEGVTTGISSQDRATTILRAASKNAKPDEFVKPGHILPLRAREGGVLVRCGQTEGSVDLTRLAGLEPAAVICEVLNPDGTMARIPQLVEFCKKHNMKIASVATIINYRRRKERLIEKIAVANLPTKFGNFKLHLYKSLVDEYLHIALCMGEIGDKSGSDGKSKIFTEPILVRVQSECITGDVFSSLRCDCHNQLISSIQTISKEGRGVFLYIRQEGRGIGLVNKMHAYALQDEGLDTVEANKKLGFPDDLRDYGIGAQILVDLGLRKIRLLTNNPKKIKGLDGFDLEIVERVPIKVELNKENYLYLKTKKEKLGHLIELEDTFFYE